MISAHMILWYSYSSVNIWCAWILYGMIFCVICVIVSWYNCDGVTIKYIIHVCVQIYLKRYNTLVCDMISQYSNSTIIIQLHILAIFKAAVVLSYILKRSFFFFFKEKNRYHIPDIDTLSHPYYSLPVILRSSHVSRKENNRLSPRQNTFFSPLPLFSRLFETVCTDGGRCSQKKNARLLSPWHSFVFSLAMF